MYDIWCLRAHSRGASTTGRGGRPMMARPGVPVRSSHIGQRSRTSTLSSQTAHLTLLPKGRPQLGHLTVSTRRCRQAALVVLAGFAALVARQ